jgi:hypothetical protein
MPDDRVSCTFGLRSATVRSVRAEAERLGTTPSRLVESVLGSYLDALRLARAGIKRTARDQAEALP